MAAEKKYICRKVNFTNTHMYEVGDKALESDLLLKPPKPKPKGFNERAAIEAYFDPMKTTEDFVEPSAEDIEE